MKLYLSSLIPSVSLHQDISHRFDVYVAIIWGCGCCIATRVAVIRRPCCTKPYSRIAAIAVVLVVTIYTNPCSRHHTGKTADSVKAFLVTIILQGASRAKQHLPRVAT